MIFGPGAPFADRLRRATGTFPNGRIQATVAWATDEGAAIFLDAVRGLSAIEVLVGINAQGTTVEALIRLLEGTSYLGVHYRHPRLTYHPKAYVIDDGDENAAAGIVAVGSSNMTTGGLYSNVETSLMIGPEGAEVGLALASWRSQWSRLLRSRLTTAITSVDVVEALYRAGHVPTEQERKRRRAKETAGRPRPIRASSSDGSVVGQVPDLPTEQRKTPPTVGHNAVVIPFAVERMDVEHADPAHERPADFRPELRWWKKLTVSDAHRKPAPSHQRNYVALTKAGFTFDWRTWFRDELLGELDWSTESMRSGKTKEVTVARFEVYIDSDYLGARNLRFDHAPHRIANQNNAPTYLNWSSMLPVIESRNFTGWWLELAKLSDGAYRLRLLRDQPS